MELLRKTYRSGGNKFPPYIFSELRAIHEMAYNYASEEQPEDLVENLADTLNPCHSYPPEYLLTGGELLFEEDDAAVMEMLELLVIGSARVDVMSSLGGVAADFAVGSG
jgi:secreted Zn-dependent insulinase-like peptidase